MLSFPVLPLRAVVDIFELDAPPPPHAIFDFCEQRWQCSLEPRFGGCQFRQHVGKATTCKAHSLEDESCVGNNGVDTVVDYADFDDDDDRPMGGTIHSDNLPRFTAFRRM